jgi:hypothetical protein
MVYITGDLMRRRTTSKPIEMGAMPIIEGGGYEIVEDKAQKIKDKNSISIKTKEGPIKSHDSDEKLKKFINFRFK